jgi:predicted amidophosphoribosyltransferase
MARSLRNRLALILDSFTRLFRILKPVAQELGSQRMCPSCGLITPRAQPFCLECGKPLRIVQLSGKT